GTSGGTTRRCGFSNVIAIRSWRPIPPGGVGMTGADPANRITTCSAKPGAVACNELSDALLISSAGTTSAADPAIEFTAPGAQVIKLSLRAYLPSGPEQTI